MSDVEREQARERVKLRLRQIGIGVAGVALGLLVGLASQAGPARTLRAEAGAARTELEAVRAELRLHGLETRVGAAMAEAARGNYERARQLMSSFYQELAEAGPSITDPAGQEAARLAGLGRDDMITLLSRAAPESVQRLTMLYTRLYLAFDAFGRASPGMVTPPAPDSSGA